MAYPSPHNTARFDNAIGIEIADGGMRLNVAQASTSGAIRRRRLSAAPTPDEAVDALNDLITELIRDDTAPHPDAIGVAVGGDVDPARGVILSMPHTDGWDEFPLADLLVDHWQNARLSDVRSGGCRTCGGEFGRWPAPSSGAVHPQRQDDCQRADRRRLSLRRSQRSRRDAGSLAGPARMAHDVPAARAATSTL